MEETYLFSSLLTHLRELSQGNPSLTTRCLLAAFWKIYDEKSLFEPLIESLENEIKTFIPDPTRESNRTKKVFACAAYKAIARKPKHDEIVRNYLSYAVDSKDWLGQPRIVCCVAFIKDEPLGQEARDYLKDNFSVWLSQRRDDFVSIALLALRSEVSRGDLQKTLERIETRIDDLPLSLLSLYLIGISKGLNLPNSTAVQDKLYQTIKAQLATAPLASLGDEGIIFAATALYLAKYHRILGYHEKYASELKETLALKGDFSSATKKSKAQNRVLCITLVIAIGLLCLMFYLPMLVAFEKNHSAFGQILLALNAKKEWALVTSLVLTAYILVSYFKRGDPIFGIVEYGREKFPGVFKEDKKG